MSIESTLYSTLTTNNGVTALLGTRIYPVQAPASATLPYAVYQRVSTEITNTLAGDAGLDWVTIQVTSWSASYDEAISCATAVRSALASLGFCGDIQDDYDGDYQSDGISGVYGARIEVTI